MSIIDVLLIAWVLTWFDLDKTSVEAINEILGKNYSTSVYWLVALIIGILVFIIENFHHRN